jgi:hypothetical protein
VIDFIQLAAISTRNVDNYVDKPLLTSRKRSIDAGFNKMPNLQAKIVPFKINGLHAMWFGERTQHQKIPTNSYSGG